MHRSESDGTILKLMKAVIQRVSHASVTVEQRVVGSIAAGLLMFVCAERDDSPQIIEKFVNKVLKLRIFSDAHGKMNRSITDIDGMGALGGLLIVSQFTLAAKLWDGNRPSFTDAAPPAHARRCYEDLLGYARSQHPIVEAGEFGADMKVALLNDGPVTFFMELNQAS